MLLLGNYFITTCKPQCGVIYGIEFTIIGVMYIAPPILPCRSHYERHAYLLDEERSAMLTNMAAGIVDCFNTCQMSLWLLTTNVQINQSVG